MEDATVHKELAEVEEKEEEVKDADEWGPPEYYHSKVNVDDVLKELVERKSKLQSFTQFNLDYAVDVSKLDMRSSLFLPFLNTPIILSTGFEPRIYPGGGLQHKVAPQPKRIAQ